MATFRSNSRYPAISPKKKKKNNCSYWKIILAIIIRRIWLNLTTTYGYHNYFNVLIIYYKSSDNCGVMISHSSSSATECILREALSMIRHILRLPATHAITGFEITQLLITIRAIEGVYIIIYVILCTLSGIVCGLENVVVVIIFTHRYIL